MISRPANEVGLEANDCENLAGQAQRLANGTANRFSPKDTI